MSEQLAQLEKKGGGENLDLTGKTRILNQQVDNSYTYTFNGAYKNVVVLVPTLRFGSTATCSMTLNGVSVSNILTSDYVPYNTTSDGQARAIATIAIISKVKVGDILKISCTTRGKAQIYV